MESNLNKWSQSPHRLYVLRAVSAGAMVAAWLVAGTFFAFSDFVMVALSQMDAGSGITAMQAMNIAVEERVFVLLANGLIVLSTIFLAWWAFFRGPFLLGLGGLIFLVGAALPTVIGNIPLNQNLADVTSIDSATQVAWPSFVSDWLFYNHIRFFACIAAALCFSCMALSSTSLREATI